MNSNTPQEIPTVDISAFTNNGSLETREATAKEFARCCKVHGCVGITGHSVPTDLLAEAFPTSKDLFDLPLEDKMKAPHPDDVTPHRGCSSIGKEKAADADDTKRKEELLKMTDYKESYETGSEENQEQYNIWLPESVLPGFGQFITELFWKLNSTAVAIPDVLIMSLGLNENEAEYIERLHSGHNSQVRLLHYPPVRKGIDTSRLAAYADWSSFTLLFQEAQGGLGSANRDTGIYPSATHRVTFPTAPKSGRDGDRTTSARFSIPYFVMPESEGIVQRQLSCTFADQKARYELITYRDFSDQLFHAIEA